MSVIANLDEEECYLWAILSDPSGLDQAEFCITDETTQDGCFRAWDFQWAWWRNTDSKQIEMGSRSSGKSLSIRYRALAFPFIHPGEEMLITAPEGNHLDALTDNIEIAYTNNRLPREMLAKGRSGIKHRPFHLSAQNGARIMGRIPQRTGTGVKGQHPLWLELDEGQDYYEAGWNELVETVKQFGEENPEQQAAAQWRAHGVTRGPNGKFYEFTKPEKGWTIHHYPAMYRPTWSDAEREDKIKTYGHRDSPDFRRNVYGMHGDSGSPLFVLHRLMESVDVEVSSNYNQNEYWHCKIEDAAIREHNGDPLVLLDPPGSHLMDYKVFWIGMDVGFTLAPSAITIFAEVPGKKAGEAKLKLIGRLMLWRVGTPDQVKIMLWLIQHYRPEAFAMDSTGAGLPLYQQAQDDARNDPELIDLLGRIRGYNFSSKIPVEFDDKVEIDENDPLGYEAALIKRPVLEHSSDVLRGLVDAHRLILPWDQELIGEFRGEMWTYVSGGALDLYGRKKSYANGSLHTLDASRMAALAWKQAPMEEFLRQQQATQDAPVETIILDW